MKAVAKNQRKGYTFGLLSSLITGITVVSNVFSLNLGVNPFTLLVCVYIFALSASLLFVARKRRLGKLVSLMRAHKYPMAAMGIINGIMSTTWIYSLAIIGPAILGFLGRFSTIAIIILSVLFLKEKFTKTEALGGIVAFAGALVVSYGTGETAMTGILLALVSNAFFAISQIISKVYVSRVPPMEMNTIRIFFMLAFVTALGFATGTIAAPPVAALPFLLIAGVAGPFFSFYLYFRALETTNLSKVALITSIEPLAILVASYITFGDIMTLREAAGSVLIFVGVMVIILARHAPKLIARFLLEE